MSKCIRCGYCCRKGPCPNRDSHPESGECRHLEVLLEANDFNLYRCALYGEGQDLPEVASVLKIGAGCEVEFNESRRKIAYSSGPPIDWSTL